MPAPLLPQISSYSWLTQLKNLDSTHPLNSRHTYDCRGHRSGLRTASEIWLYHLPGVTLGTSLEFSEPQFPSLLKEIEYNKSQHFLSTNLWHYHRWLILDDEDLQETAQPVRGRSIPEGPSLSSCPRSHCLHVLFEVQTQIWLWTTPYLKV